MKKVRIIIFSANRSLRDFFMLEALNFDFGVECFERLEKVHSDISEYDVAFIDADTVKQRPLNAAKRQFIVSCNRSDADITYPFSIEVLRDIYRQALSGDACVKKDSTDDALRIIFYKNEKNLVELKGKKYIFSDAEYNLLLLLCSNAHETVSRERINELFDAKEGNIADVYICKLRKKTEEPLGKRLIYTVRSKGYKIITDMEWR